MGRKRGEKVDVSNETSTFAQYCEDCGLSRPTVYRWLERYDSEFKRIKSKEELEEEKHKAKYQKLKENEYEKEGIIFQLRELLYNKANIIEDLEKTFQIIKQIKDYFYDLKENSYLIISELNDKEIKQVFILPEIKRSVNPILQSLISYREKIDKLVNEIFSDVDQKQIKKVENKGYIKTTWWYK